MLKRAERSADGDAASTSASAAPLRFTSGHVGTLIRGVLVVSSVEAR